MEEYLSKEEELEILVTAYNKTAKKVSGLGSYEPGKLENIVVNVIQYPKYYFLIGKTCKVEKISEDEGNTFTDIDKYIKGPSNAINEDWRKILRLAEIDDTEYDNYAQALEESQVTEAIGTHEQSIDCLINSSDEIIETTIESQAMLEELAKNEYSAKKIVNNDKWFEKIDSSEQNLSFFNNINISATEEINSIEDENPYYTFEAKANKTYFIQCFGAQGGSYSNELQGGYGGYSFGILRPRQNTKLYIYLGGQGKGCIANSASEGGYNGGGAIVAWSDGNEKRATGGGATHIALIQRIIIKFRRK